MLGYSPAACDVSNQQPLLHIPVTEVEAKAETVTEIEQQKEEGGA